MTHYKILRIEWTLLMNNDYQNGGQLTGPPNQIILIWGLANLARFARD